MQLDDAVATLAEDVWQWRLARSPYLQQRVGVPVTELRPMGIEDVEEDAAYARDVLTRLDGIALEGLPHEDALTCGFLRQGALLAAEAPQHHWHTFAATPYGSYFLSHLVQSLFGTFTFDGAGQTDLYLSLLHDFGGMVREIHTKTAEQASRGIRIPQPALPLVQASLAGMSAGSAAGLLPQAARLERLGTGASEFLERVERTIAAEVTAPFQETLALLDDNYAALAPADVGLHQYDGGIEAYEFLIRMRNTVSRPAEEIHKIGLDEVSSLAGQMAKVRAEIGFTGTEQEFHEQLKNEPSLYASTPAEVEAHYEACMTRLEPHLTDYFHVLPKAPYGVKRLPEELEAGMTYGYYEPPHDTEPVGLYRYNASALDQRSLLTADAICFHELAPGHHFHLARQSENLSLPAVRREAIELGAFNEGWAEYAAGLALEMGVYASPLQRYGRLAHERFTAQRMVVDTGMNAFAWSLEQGRAYMRENTLESDAQVATEVLRYSVDLPAQALGYRLGFLAITGARRRAEAALGNRFDKRDFHEMVLASGALPLDMLDEHVNWCVAQAGSPAP